MQLVGFNTAEAREAQRADLCRLGYGARRPRPRSRSEQRLLAVGEQPRAGRVRAGRRADSEARGDGAGHPAKREERADERQEAVGHREDEPGTARDGDERRHRHPGDRRPAPHLLDLEPDGERDREMADEVLGVCINRGGV